MTAPVRQYRRRPVVVSARGPLTAPEDVVTLEGTLRADAGDFVVTGVAGESWPVKPAIFAATYEPVEDA